MGWLRFGVGLEPFLQPAIGTDLIRREPGTFVLQLSPEFLIHAEQLRRAVGVAEQLAQQLYVDCRSHADLRVPAVRQAERVLR